MSQLTISLDDTQVRKKLDALTRGVRDFRRPLDEIGDDMLDIYGNRVFQDQGVPAGEPWRKLSVTTLLARQHRSGYYKNTPIVLGKILIWTGRLMRGFRKHVSPTRLVVDNTVPYFKHHQESRGRTPQRRMLFLNAKIVLGVLKRIEQHVNNTLR